MVFQNSSFCNSFLQHHPTPLERHRQEKTEKMRFEQEKTDGPEPMIEEVRNEMQELVRAQKNIERFLQRKRTPPRKHRPAKRIPPRSFPSWETSSAVFLVYMAVLRSNAPVTRIFSLRSFPRAAAGKSLYSRLRNLYTASQDDCLY